MTASDGPGVSVITGHMFTPPAGQPWARCIFCSLSEAAHLNTGDEYAGDAPYRCPYCVHVEIDPCPHGRQGALSLKGESLGGES